MRIQVFKRRSRFICRPYPICQRKRRKNCIRTYIQEICRRNITVAISVCISQRVIHRMIEKIRQMRFRQIKGRDVRISFFQQRLFSGCQSRKRPAGIKTLIFYRSNHSTASRIVHLCQSFFLIGRQCRILFQQTVQLYLFLLLLFGFILT